MIGEFNERITLQSENPTADAYGGSVMAWTNVATIWARVEPVSGREGLQAQQLQSPVTHRVMIRYRGDVTAKHRVLWRNRPLNIIAAPDAGAMSAYQELLCNEGVAT